MSVCADACVRTERLLRQRGGKENIRLAVDSYLANCKTGDYEAADAFLTEDADDSLGTAQIYEQLDSQLADLGLGDDFDREARVYFFGHFRDLQGV